MTERYLRTYRVVVNRNKRYSILPSRLKMPSGWEEAGKSGSAEECLEFVRRLSGLETAEDSETVPDSRTAGDALPSYAIPTVARPLVSIIMPTYNREKLLPVAIGSILNQTYANWELLVVDDRSTDGTKALIENYSKRDGRIRYLASGHAKGPGGARVLSKEKNWFADHGA